MHASRPDAVCRAAAEARTRVSAAGRGRSPGGARPRGRRGIRGPGAPDRGHHVGRHRGPTPVGGEQVREQLVGEHRPPVLGQERVYRALPEQVPAQRRRVQQRPVRARGTLHPAIGSRPRPNRESAALPLIAQQSPSAYERRRSATALLTAQIAPKMNAPSMHCHRGMPPRRKYVITPKTADPNRNCQRSSAAVAGRGSPRGGRPNKNRKTSPIEVRREDLFPSSTN